jgi:outer membrane receptor protein involved in Fe transport
MRLAAGLQGVASYALQRAEDVQTGRTLVNSPAQMATLRLTARGPSKSSVSVELLSMSTRRTLAGETVKPTTRANVTTTIPLARGFELVGIVRNLFDGQYADPASTLDSVVQNGRTLRAGLSWKFMGK